MKHYSVMRDVAINNLNIKDDGVYVDATLGYAGHSKEILKRIKKGFLFAFDADSEAINYSNELLRDIGNNFKLIHTNFMNLGSELDKLDVSLVDGFIFDLGLSSPEIDDASRGFSFMNDATLDMRMDTRGEVTAETIINNYSLEELTNLFYKYAEEPRSKVIANSIINYRKTKRITSTLELVKIIEMSVGANYFYKKHPERVIFQALRIEVNRELEAIEKALPEAIKRLKKGGRICVITFHSLEDRIVKNIFKKYSEVPDIFRGLPEADIPIEYRPLIKLINKKPILPSEEELKDNSRSKSAKLRVIERI
ncbi:MAG: 16S rRNA (cytosine(1402)-N(4))-methyltransferase RsmH [Ruminococcus sp.]|nr:16S rRNA (cytosine(1402)-N(4))-methyltransferase RsmH [Ruminococcus sp.]